MDFDIFVDLIEPRIPVGMGISDLIWLAAGMWDGRETRRKDVCTITVEWKRNKAAKAQLAGRWDICNNKHDEMNEKVSSFQHFHVVIGLAWCCFERVIEMNFPRTTQRYVKF